MMYINIDHLNMDINERSKPWLFQSNYFIRSLLVFWSFCILCGCRYSEKSSGNSIQIGIDSTNAPIGEKAGKEFTIEKECLNCKAPSARSLLLKKDAKEGKELNKNKEVK